VKRHTLDPRASETSGSSIADRSIEPANQRWNRGKSAALAASEGIDFNDEHWAVIVFHAQVLS
jgi:sulfur relay (sulfurtransferase) DsrC/TusE family protein